MKIIPIFTENSEGLHSIHYPHERECEFYRLFELWNDAKYLLNFCQENAADIFTPFWGQSSLEDFVKEIIKEGRALERLFYEYSENGFYPNSKMLQSIFRPIINYESTLPVLQLSKAKIYDTKYFSKPKLRLYALRLNENSFILTGGCIKLVHLMKESAHTQMELEKLDLVKKYLKSQQIITLDDLIYYYEQQ